MSNGAPYISAATSPGSGRKSSTGRALGTPPAASGADFLGLLPPAGAGPHHSFFADGAAAPAGSPASSRSPAKKSESTRRLERHGGVSRTGSATHRSPLSPKGAATSRSERSPSRPLAAAKGASTGAAAGSGSAAAVTAHASQTQASMAKQPQAAASGWSSADTAEAPLAPPNSEGASAAPSAGARPPSLDEIAAYPPAADVIAAACAALPQGPLLVALPGRGAIDAAALLAPGSAAAALDALRADHPRLAVAATVAAPRPAGSSGSASSSAAGGSARAPKGTAGAVSALAGASPKGRRGSGIVLVDDAAAIAALARARSVRSPWMPEEKGLGLGLAGRSTDPGSHTSALAGEAGHGHGADGLPHKATGTGASGGAGTGNGGSTWTALRGLTGIASPARLPQQSPAAAAEAYLSWRREHERLRHDSL